MNQNAGGTESNVVPILTEVVPGMAPTTVDTGAAAHSVAQAAQEAAEAAGFVMDEESLVDAVIERLDRQVDHLFEYRLREAVQPLLVRLTDALVADCRDQIASTVRDIVRRAVHQEVLRQRRPRD